MHEKLQNWINWTLYDELVDCKINAPKQILGNHPYEGGQVITAYRPDATGMEIVARKGKASEWMEQINDRGFFGLCAEKDKYKDYSFRVHYGDGNVIEIDDPYVVPTQISSMDCYLFGEGKHYEIYEKLGAHPMTIKDRKSVV